jgi:hypothetical protein
MPACNNKPCTVTRYYFRTFEVDSSTPEDGGAALTKAQAKTALEASESFRGRVGGVGYNPKIGESAALPAGEAGYFYLTDQNTCEGDECKCHIKSPAKPTIQPDEIMQSFDFPGVKKGNKSYTVTIKATCVLWDFAGLCRPRRVTFARLRDRETEEYASSGKRRQEGQTV